MVSHVQLDPCRVRILDVGSLSAPPMLCGNMLQSAPIDTKKNIVRTIQSDVFAQGHRTLAVVGVEWG